MPLLPKGILHPQLQSLLNTAQLSALVEVIVQKQAGEASGALENAISRLGGRKTLDLSIINGFAAQVPVRALPILAAMPGVKWISPDGEVKTSALSSPHTGSKVFLPMLHNRAAGNTPISPAITATATPTPSPTSAQSTATPSATPTATTASSSPTPIAPTASATVVPTLVRSFYRAINLGGPAISIDGLQWEGETASNMTWGSEKYAEAGGIVKDADATMEAMLRDGVRDSKGNTRVSLKNVPYGVYDIVLYSWEFGNPQGFNLDIEGRPAQLNVRNDASGAWQKLGPFRVLIFDGEININTSGGYAHLSGLEVWKIEQKEDPSPVVHCYSLPRQAWRASSSVAGSTPFNAIDADLKTKWMTDSQVEGMWLQLDLGERRTFDTIDFDSGKHPALDYKLQVADTDGDWAQQPVIASGRSGEAMTIATRPRLARYVRISLTSTNRAVPWSIYEFGIYDCAATQLAARTPNAFEDAIGLTRLRAENPRLQGQGVGIAILDSGVNDTSDLTTMIGTNRVLYSVRVNDDINQTPDDGYGHGNHIAGILAGNGSASAGKYMGIAPGVNLINVKVSNDDGSGRTSRIVAGMQWALQNRDRLNIRVVNLSLNSGEYESYQNNPLTAAAEILWFSKIVVVVSAGNKGSGNLYPPANDPFVITVGAVDDRGTGGTHDDIMPVFSAYGTTPEGIAKPDLVAPGVNIVGLRTNQNSRLSRLHPSHNVSDYYFRMSGTSMAAPMVAAAAAILLQNEPELTPDQVKYRLMKTARPFGNPAQTGAGYLDIYAALTTPTNESANVGLRPSALLSTGDEPINPTVSWNSVSWNSVSWNSVSWNSVSWNSVSWNSDHWETR